MFQRILVAVDGSPVSILALHEALRLAKDGSKLKVVTMVENPLIGYGQPMAGFNHDTMHQAFIEEGTHILRNAENDAKHLGHCAIETQLIDMDHRLASDIAPTIMQSAAEFQADLIVIGTHGRRGIKRFFLGSVAEAVIRQSRIPVLSIRGEPDLD